MRIAFCKLGAFASAVVLCALVPSSRGQNQLETGYTLLSTDSGSPTPVGAALFSFTNQDGVLVSQAGVAAAVPTRSGRIFVDQVGAETGIALVNTASTTATATLILRDSGGLEVARRTQTLRSREHLARFVSELFAESAANLRGSLTFESDQLLAAITLREVRNVYGEPLYTTLPVINMNAPPSNNVRFFPQIAVGEGYSTQVILINPGNEIARGRLFVTASNGTGLRVSLNGVVSNVFNYEIAPNGTYRAEFESTGGLNSGWMQIIPETGSVVPGGSAIFQLKENGHVVTEAGVEATALTTAVRIFVDNAGTRTGLAVANLAGTSNAITFTLMNTEGGVEAITSRSLGSGNHLAAFANELFPTLTEGFTGVMEIRSSSGVSLAAVTLKLTTNSRNNLVLATLPVSNMAVPPNAATVYFPHIAIGAEFSTRLILINSSTSGTATGRTNFYRSDGTSMTVGLSGQYASLFAYRISSNGGRQFLPGAAPRVGRITIVDPETNTESREVVVNEGSSVRPRLRVVDSTGVVRDDLTVIYASTNPDVASVDAQGNILGRRAGFSTLVMTATGIVATATVTVVSVSAGAAGFQPSAVAQDLASRLYLASSANHTILLAESLGSTPSLYAGITQSPGLKNAPRLESQFRVPGFIEFNQAEGSLYVSDTGNHVIRRVQAGASGQVETFAGTGAPGSRDGALAQATFNAPQGLALDGRGNLWVADSGNHVIRRIRLSTGMVETIAGVAGVPGLADGMGAEARFNSPMGLSVEPEGPTAQLERERRGEPPPPVSVVAADSANGVIRRVREDGLVETIRIESNSAAIGLIDFKRNRVNAAGDPILFESPSGVDVDPFDNIYITEPNSGRVRVILRNRGEIVPAAQGATFRSPRSIVTREDGRFVVADSTFAPLQVSYAAPRIASVAPATIGSRGGETVTVKGSNFAPGSIVVVGGFIAAATTQNTETIAFTAPPLGGGRTTITVQNRGGVGQFPLLVTPIPLGQLPVGYITTVAGGTTFSGDGQRATAGRVTNPQGMAIDAAGNLYIADSGNSKIRKIDARRGIINTVAGTGDDSFSGDDGPAIAAGLNTPASVAVDASGNIYIADSLNARIRGVDGRTGTITTMAGNGREGFSGDGGPATAAQINRPSHIAVDSAGNVYFSDLQNHRIRKVTTATGIISTIAGSGPVGSGAGAYGGDNGLATSARLNRPQGIVVDASGNVYFCDTDNSRVRKITAASGVITTVAGGVPRTGTSIGDDGLATAAVLATPIGLAADARGNLYIGDVNNNRVRKLSVTAGIITTVAGDGRRTNDIPPNSVTATSVSFNLAQNVTVDASGNLYIADFLANRVYRVASANGFVRTITGGLTDVGDGGPAIAAVLNQPGSIVIDASGNILMADTFNHRIRRVDAATGIINTIAGTGTGGSDIRDGGPALSAELQAPRGLSLDRAGNIYFADQWNARIRKITVATGSITTIAGTGRSGFSGDNGNALSATMNGPTNTVVDAEGNVYFSDRLNHRVRRISPAGTIATVAGNGGTRFSGDNGPAVSASLQYPEGLAIDTSGNLLIADKGNQRVRRVDLRSGVITTVVGGGAAALREDVPATSIGIGSPFGIAVSPGGIVYVADFGWSMIDRVLPNGLIRRIAGFFGHRFAGDGGPAIAAIFKQPQSVAVDSAGNVYIADTQNNRIRAIKGPLQ